MKKIKCGNKRKWVAGKSKLIEFGLLCGLFVCLGFFAFQGVVFYQNKIENDRLVALKNEYASLCEKIDEYKVLKGQYEVVLNNNNDLNSSKESLEKKISELESDIEALESKIADVNKKIKNLS